MVILIFLLKLSTEPDEFSIKIRETICVVKVGVLVIVASVVATLLKSLYVRLSAERSRLLLALLQHFSMSAMST
jgi:hypothetical protein